MAHGAWSMEVVSDWVKSASTAKLGEVLGKTELTQSVNLTILRARSIRLTRSHTEYCVLYGEMRVHMYSQEPLKAQRTKTK